MILAIWITHPVESLSDYDWDTDDGRDNLGGWIEEAAANAGR